MLFALPQPVRGCTHIDFVQIEILSDGIYMTGRYGTINDVGDFVADEYMTQAVHRRIAGDEYGAFLELPLSGGLPDGLYGNFRSTDLKAWLAKYGYRNEATSWVSKSSGE